MDYAIPETKKRHSKIELIYCLARPSLIADIGHVEGHTVKCALARSKQGPLFESNFKNHEADLL
jgi:hypothetical protein